MQELKKDVLYSFDEKVRVEIGPQIVELDCTKENLDNRVTHAVYKVGKIDAYGKPITEERVSTAGTKMHCVDRRAKLVPHLWKVYQMQKISKEALLAIMQKALEAGVKPNLTPDRFIKINEFKEKEDALAFAKTTFEEMQ